MEQLHLEYRKAGIQNNRVTERLGGPYCLLGPISWGSDE